MNSAMALPCAILAAVSLLVPGPRPVTARLRSAPERLWRAPRGSERTRDDPLAVATVFDLLAACLRAGLPTVPAVRAVLPGAPEALRTSLRRSADLLALGADPSLAWGRSGPAAATTPEFESLARMVRRSARSGSALAAAVGELAEQRRGEVEDAAAARAERAGVLIGGPLGLCFLPAFICLGIVPVIIGLAGRVLGGGLL
ncbi:type II secretion system F family protein [Nocardia brevicatena]|uniref:type II secretion system F family protein n=1 Tax=Nocardia brevicatena TaxID=37327 RepID=UPI0002FBDDAD|nr:type II secretion system F family protein [Nocardia brevicatena]